MLSARYLAGCTDDLVKLYSQLESDIVKDMAKRLKRCKGITNRTEYQARILQEIGGLQTNINTLLKKYNAAGKKDVIALFQEAAAKAIKNDVQAYAAAQRNLSENQKQVLEATAGKLNGVSVINSNKKVRKDFAEGQAIKVFSGFQRLTMTIADSSAAEFVQQANAAYMQVASGAFTYDQAFKLAVDNLAMKGVTTNERPVIYKDSGQTIKRSIESAVRANIMTGINQTCSEITNQNCADLGTRLVEVSAHMGARPEHAEWQGKIYSLDGDIYNDDGTIKYRSFQEVCQPGEPTGIGGINCRHSYYPYFEGMPPEYSNGQLDEMRDNEINVDGQKITQYEAEQQLRLYERAIRKWKLKADAEETLGVDNTFARRKINEWQTKAAEWTKKTGLRRDYAREYIGTSSGVQPKGISEAKYNYKKNSELAREIKRFDNSRKKEIAGVTAEKEMTFDEADHRNPNPFFNKRSGYNENCQSCVVCYEMRRRGFNVETMPNLPGSMPEVLSHNTSLAWVDRKTGKNPAYIFPKGKTLKSKIEWLQQNLKPNETHTIEWAWRGSSGHIINAWKTPNGLINMYDPQTGSILRTFDEIKDYLHGCKVYTIQLLNISNCDVNLNVVNNILRAKKK